MIGHLQPRTRFTRRAFTLIELMISIALVVLIILGVNKVFQATTTAVGTGQALATAVADSRAAQTTFSQDFSNFVANGNGANDAPCTIISCTTVAAFRNKPDQLGQGKVSSTTINPALQFDLNANGIAGDSAQEVVSPVTYNFRNHRTDLITFFARGSFPRQTGNEGTFVANMSGQEAMIWYGHLWFADNQPTASLGYHSPGSGTLSTNPNNFYSSQFALGHAALVMRQPITGQILLNGVPQAFYPDVRRGTAASFYSPPPNPADRPPNLDQIQMSRYDLLGGSISQFRTNLMTYLVSQGFPSPAWWDSTHLDLVYNFCANPYVSKPITSTSAAQASPIMLTGCTQFIVEFAGDFVTQNNDPAATVSSGISPNNTGTYGDVTALTADGTIDFVVDKTAAPGNPMSGPNFPLSWKRSIRWYGLPRDTNGDGIVQGFKAGLSNNNLPDVVPVRDVAMTNVNGGGAPFRWEAITNLNVPSATGDYAKDMTTGTVPTYTVALGPGLLANSIGPGNPGTDTVDPRIKMVRITLVLDDPNGRLTDGQTYQYVYTLP